jgi:YcaO-like protein with predicted kinase domain
VARKSYWRGTHRTIPPAETFERFGVHADDLGIVRLANVTGLDYLGIPVFMAVRPNSRSLSVSQGKGLDCWAAKTSAFMEAAELAHAEEICSRVRVASFATLGSQAANPALLPQVKGKRLRRDHEIPWIGGRDLASGRSIFVPLELVHMNYTLPQRPGMGFFSASSNGIASGNHKLEAMCAGLCELIERDATALWRLRDREERARRRLVLSGVDDDDCRSLLEQLAERRIEVAVWDVTSNVGIACFLCRIGESPDNGHERLGAFWGAGCHVDRAVALLRAITESAQSRLTYIAGSRDDLRRSHYGESREMMLYDLASDLWEGERAARRFDEVPSVYNPDLVDDLAHLQSQLHAAGLEQIIIVDLTIPRFGIPVIRAIVPGLEPDDDHARPGPRARALQ